MPDAIQPVGAMIQPPNPTQGLNTMSSILGIQQNRQALQSGALTIQGQQQELQRSQIETQQAQGVNDFLTNWDPGAHHGDDGTVDIDSAHDSPQYKALPGVAKIAVDAKLNTIRGQQLDNKSKLATLNGTVVGQWGQLAQTLSNTEDPALRQSLMTSFAKQGPDQARIAQLYGQQYSATPPEKQTSALKAMAAQAQDVSSQQSQTNPQQMSVSTGGDTQIYNVSKEKGLQPGQQPVASVKNTLAPGEQPAYLSAAAGATSRGGGSGNADIDTSNMVVAAQRDAKTNIDLTKRIDQLADIVNPGSIPAKVSAGLGALGLQDVNQARTELQKDLGRLRGGLITRSPSDSRAAEVLSGLPTDTTPTQTIHQAMDVTRGTAKQDLALGQLREKNAATTNGQMTGFQNQFAHATSVASPLMHEYWSLPKGEQAQFLKRNSSSPQQAQELRNRFEAARGQLNVGQ